MKFQLKSFGAVSKKYPKRFDRKPDFGYTINIVIIVIGEWLNGRVAVSKTVGCVFESRLPCQKEPRLNTGEDMLQYIFVNGVAGIVAKRQRKPRSYENNYNVHGWHGRFAKLQ